MNLRRSEPPAVDATENHVTVEDRSVRVREECLNINMFWSLAQARVVISDWKVLQSAVAVAYCGRPVSR
jgi:hypothetical protein